MKNVLLCCTGPVDTAIYTLFCHWKVQTNTILIVAFLDRQAGRRHQVGGSMIKGSPATAGVSKGPRIEWNVVVVGGYLL